MQKSSVETTRAHSVALMGVLLSGQGMRPVVDSDSKQVPPQAGAPFAYGESILPKNHVLFPLRKNLFKSMHSAG